MSNETGIHKSSKVSDFSSDILYMDPDTGSIDVFVVDGEVCRMATADEILASYVPVDLPVDCDVLQQLDASPLDFLSPRARF
jgi:hypothetical protein